MSVDTKPAVAAPKSSQRMAIDYNTDGGERQSLAGQFLEDRELCGPIQAASEITEARFGQMPLRPMWKLS
jgi:hypothetical protein